MIMMVKIF